MDPSQVRTRILRDHDSLRRHLSELEAECRAMLTDSTRTDCVRGLAHEVLWELTQHTELEDEILAPALLEIDAWGQVRADQLLTHHRCQRERIHALADLYDAGLALTEIKLITESFIAELRDDMEHEERDLLHPDLLRDDIVMVACNSG
jgi:hypothetical protein